MSYIQNRPFMGERTMTLCTMYERLATAVKRTLEDETALYAVRDELLRRPEAEKMPFCSHLRRQQDVYKDTTRMDPIDFAWETGVDIQAV